MTHDQGYVAPTIACPYHLELWRSAPGAALLGWFRGLIAAALIGVAAAGQVRAEEVCPSVTQARSLGVIVPAYFYPTTDYGAESWTRLEGYARRSAAAGIDFVTIVNPSNGSFRAADPNYVAVVDRMDAAGATLVGYLSRLDPAGIERPVADVLDDIAAWKRFYPKIRGFFFDQVPNDDAGEKKAYYDQLLARARETFGEDALLIGNPGRAPHKRYRDLFDVLVVFEDVGANFSDVVLPKALRKQKAKRFACLVHTSGSLAAPSDRTRLCRVAREIRFQKPTGQNGGWWFVTTDDLVATDPSGFATPYDTLGESFDRFFDVTCWVNRLARCE